MSVSVRLPASMLKTVSSGKAVEVEANNLNEVLAEIEAKYAGFTERVCDEKGQFRRFINVFVNEENIRFLNGIDTVLNDGDEICFIPAIAGG